MTGSNNYEQPTQACATVYVLFAHRCTLFCCEALYIILLWSFVQYFHVQALYTITRYLGVQALYVIVHYLGVQALYTVVHYFAVQALHDDMKLHIQASAIELLLSSCAKVRIYIANIIIYRVGGGGKVQGGGGGIQNQVREWKNGKLQQQQMKEK